MTPRSRRTAAVFAAALFAMLAVAAVVAQAGTPRDRLRTGDDIVIAAGETVDHDLYAFGQTVTVNGTIHGDLVAAATQIIIAGTIDGDVLAAASTIAVTGFVHGDLRAAASNVTISGTVDEDAAVLGSELLLAVEGRIGEDLLFATGETTLEGDVGGGIEGTAGAYVRRGSVGGPESVAIPDTAGAAPDRTLSLALDAIRQLVVVVLIGAIGLRRFPRGIRTVVATLRTRPVQSMGVGVLGLLGYLVAIVTLVLFLIVAAIVLGRLDFGALLGIVVFGAIVAGLVLTFLLIAFGAFGADVLVGLALGRLIAIPDGRRWEDLLRLVVGAAIVVVLTSFPVVGSLVKLLVIVAGLGAVVLTIQEQRRAPAALIVGPGAGPNPPAAPA